MIEKILNKAINKNLTLTKEELCWLLVKTGILEKDYKAWRLYRRFIKIDIDKPSKN